MAKTRHEIAEQVRTDPLTYDLYRLLKEAMLTARTSSCPDALPGESCPSCMAEYAAVAMATFTTERDAVARLAK
jgi:hypothetical protein